MIINTNLAQYSSAVNWAASVGIKINIINGNDYELAKHAEKPDYVISHTCHTIQNDFPDITFIGPECSFPGVQMFPEVGFNRDLLDKIPRVVIPADVIYVNKTGSFQSKLLIKKIEDMGLNLKVYGHGFGISQFNTIKVTAESAYKGVSAIAADDEEEIYKALYLGKVCLTPFNFAHCFNVFDIKPNTNLTASEAQQDFALQNSWENVFNRMGVPTVTYEQ